MTTHSILWQRIDLPGHEAAQLFADQSGWHLNGTAVFVHVHQPCRLDYQIQCDANWQTQWATVRGWVGNQAVALEITADHARRWQVNGQDCPAVTGYTDLDLNFSPSTNLLPIRRLNLAIGAQAAVKAAWLRFPSFQLEPFDQTYRRLDQTHYQYTSNDGNFSASLTVNDAGFVTDYPNLWTAVANP